MPQFNDPTVELTSLEKDDVLMSGSPTDFANIKAQNVFNTSLTRAALQTLISASELIIGHKYTITNAVTSTLVLVCEAVAVNKLDEIAINASNGDNVSYDITTDIATAIQQTQINGTGFVKASGTTLSYDNSTYLTTIEGIAAGGELEGNYASPTLKNSSVVGKVLTGLSVTGSAVVSTDSVLAAIGKLQNQVNGLAGGVEYQGTWNASTNTPTLTSSVGTQGFYYVVSVAGSTNLNGITTWELGDWAIFNGATWQKVDNTDAVVSVNGYTGIVTLSASDVSAVPTSSISGTSGTIPLFGASNTLGNSVITQSGSVIGVAGAVTFNPSDNAVGTIRLYRGTTAPFLSQSLILDASGGNTNIRNLSTDSARTIDLSFSTDGTSSYTTKLSLSPTQLITFGATGSEAHIFGGSARVNGTLFVSQPISADELVLGVASAFLTATSNAQVGWAGGFAGYTNGTLILQSRSSTETPIVFATGTTPAERMKLSSTELITFGATDTGEAHIFGGSARVNGNLTAQSNIDLTGDLRYQSNVGYGLKSANGTRLFEVYNTGISFVTALSGTSATFSSSVTADGFKVGAGTFDFNSGDALLDYSSASVRLRTYKVGFGYITPLLIDSQSGAATFSSSVTIGNKTTTEINALTPATGMTVFNTTLGTLCFYDGAAWKKVTHSAM